MPGNVAPGVPGGVDDGSLVAGKFIGLAGLDGLVDPRDAPRIGPVCHHFGAMAGLEGGDGGDMVVMVVGDQNVGQLPSGVPQRLLDGGLVGGIDGGAGRGALVVQQNAEIVLTTEELMYVEL